MPVLNAFSHYLHFNSPWLIFTTITNFRQNDVEDSSHIHDRDIYVSSLTQLPTHSSSAGSPPPPRVPPTGALLRILHREDLVALAQVRALHKVSVDKVAERPREPARQHGPRSRLQGRAPQDGIAQAGGNTPAAEAVLREETLSELFFLFFGCHSGGEGIDRAWVPGASCQLPVATFHLGRNFHFAIEPTFWFWTWRALAFGQNRRKFGMLVGKWGTRYTL